MIAGTLAVASTTAEQPFESDVQKNQTSLDILETQATFDGDAAVQKGRAATRVERQTERVYVDGDSIAVEDDTTREWVWTDWVGVPQQGWVCAERVRDPGQDEIHEFPFGILSRAGEPVFERVNIDVHSLVRDMRDADRTVETWMSLRSERQDEEEVSDTKIGYGAYALDKDAIQESVGWGFRAEFRGSILEGVVYESGYVALFTARDEATFAQFVGKAVVPHAYVPTTDQDQATLEEVSA